MEISGSVQSIITLSTLLSQQRTSETAGLLVLKKAMRLQEAGTMALIASIAPTPSSANLPAHLGQNVNTTA